jgi:hypothetical protein
VRAEKLPLERAQDLWPYWQRDHYQMRQPPGGSLWI